MPMTPDSAPLQDPRLRGDVGHNDIIYSVSEVSHAIKRMVEDRFGVVKLRGEITGYKLATSGHCYFRLKDENAVIDAVMWRGTLSKLRLKPEDGLEVVVAGKLTTYPGKSSYQIVVDGMEAAGAGALMLTVGEERSQIPVAASDRYRHEVEDFAEAILQERAPQFTLIETLRNAEVLDRLMAASR